MHSSPPVAQPITPTIGRIGKATRSFMWMIPSSTRKIRVTGLCTFEISCPKPGMIIAAPRGPGLISSSSTTSESPGSAPRTAIGPVAELSRSRSSEPKRSDSFVTCPLKQSFSSSRITRARVDLQHRLHRRPEGPDVLVPRDLVVDRQRSHGGHHATGPVSPAAAQAAGSPRTTRNTPRAATPRPAIALACSSSPNTRYASSAASGGVR